MLSQNSTSHHYLITSLGLSRETILSISEFIEVLAWIPQEVEWMTIIVLHFQFEYGVACKVVEWALRELVSIIPKANIALIVSRHDLAETIAVGPWAEPIFEMSLDHLEQGGREVSECCTRVYKAIIEGF
jgi:hypothetical protein